MITANGEQQTATAKRRLKPLRVWLDRHIGPRMRFVAFSIVTEMLTFVPVHMFMEKLGII